MSNSLELFNITHHHGAKETRLPNGVKVTRKEELWVPEWSIMVPTAGYHDHFIYETEEIGPAYMCTCGSPSVMASHPDSSKTFLWICYHHSLYGTHATGGSAWV